MGIFGSVVKAGILKRVGDEARKPKNQQRIKDLVGKARGGGKSTGSGEPTPKRRR